MPEMMKNNGMWNEKIHDTRLADRDACPKTTSSMPKPRSESSAVSLELLAMTCFPVATARARSTPIIRDLLQSDSYDMSTPFLGFDGIVPGSSNQATV